MRQYIYYIDLDDCATLVRDGSHGVEELRRSVPLWQRAAEYYWREVCLGQGFNCLRQIPLEEAKDFLTRWGLDPELSPSFPEA